MAVKWVKEIPNTREATIEPEREEYVKTYLVRVDTIGESPLGPAYDPHIDALFDTWDSGPYPPGDGPSEQDRALVKRKTVKQEGDNPYLFRVTVTFGTDIGPKSRYNLNPLLRPPVVQWGFRNVNRIATKAIDGAGFRTINITNSAGDAFDPPAEYDDAYLTVTITNIEAAFLPVDAALLRGRINNNELAGYPAHCVRVMNVRADQLDESGLLLFKVTRELEFRDPLVETWDLKILDQGYHYLAGTAPDQVKSVIVDKFGQTMQSPQLLDGSGNVVPVGGNPVYLDYQIYFEMTEEQRTQLEILLL